MLRRRLLLSLLLLTTPAVHAQSGFDCVAPTAPLLSAPLVLGNGSAGSVSTAQLQAALDAGGEIRLNIGTSTLALTQELVVSRGVTLDAQGASLSGQGAHRVIRVSILIWRSAWTARRASASAAIRSK